MRQPSIYTPLEYTVILNLDDGSEFGYRAVFKSPEAALSHTVQQMEYEQPERLATSFTITAAWPAKDS